MFTQYLTTEQFNKLDPEAVCVAHDSGDGDLYVTSAAELMESAPGATLCQALDGLLDDMRRDSFEILMVNSKGWIVKVQPVEEQSELAPVTQPSLLTEEERKVMDGLVAAWSAWVKLPSLHPDGCDEFRHLIHAAQAMVMSRPVQKEFNNETAP